MDPVSITGLVGSCFSLLASTAKAIKGLHDLKGKYDDAVADAGHLLSQISTIQASVQILQKWLDSGPVTLQSNEQLMVTMEQSLDSCLLVVSSIEKHISKINYVDGMLTVRGKLRHVWDEEEVSRHKQNLSYQSQTLTLLLTAIQITTVGGQQDLIGKRENQQILRRARDNASSYIDLSDETVSRFQETIASNAPEFDVAFDFDDLALDSPAYRAAFRSLLRKDREGRQKSTAATPSPSTEREHIASQERIKAEFSRNGDYLRPNPPHQMQQRSQPRPTLREVEKSFSSLQFSTTATPEDTPSTSAARSSTRQTEGSETSTRMHSTSPAGVVRFCIRCAYGLRGSGLSSTKLDTYARVLSSMGVERSRTKICKGTNNPVWNEVIYLILDKPTDKLFLEVMLSKTVSADQSLGFTRFDPAGYLMLGGGGRYLVHNSSRARSDNLNQNGTDNGILQFDVAFHPWHEDLGQPLSVPPPSITDEEHKLYRLHVDSGSDKGKQPRLQRIYKSRFAGSRESSVNLAGQPPLKGHSIVSDEVELYERTPLLDGVSASDVEQGTELLRKLYEFQLRVWAGDIGGENSRSGLPDAESGLDEALSEELGNLLSHWAAGTPAWTDDEISELREIAGMIQSWDQKHPRPPESH